MERKCGKCKTEEGIVWTTDGARCEDCFCVVTMHSVKTILSRNKLAMFKSRICVSSNPPSTSSAALMAVLDECLKPGPKRKASRMSFEVIVLHVRLPMELFGSGEKGKESMESLAKLYGFQFQEVQLEESIVTSLKAIRDLDDRIDLVQGAVRSSLIQKTKAMECSVLLVSPNATDLAVDVMAKTIKGRGGAIPDEVDKYAVSTEFFNSPDSSLTRIAEKFVLQLQEMQPSTSTTVLRTAAKLRKNEAAMLCPACASRDVLIGRGADRVGRSRGSEDTHPLCAVCTEKDMNMSGETVVDLARAFCR
uniref:Cytoplasmic tRNA 2-thiolation protein 2 n=2 Tax=Rhodosorus marinus TaxID=101924 RepID=A0A7S3EDY8_9RHOD|mmetsp:Transcript_24938/g.98477  ORF Transcript_24938/g.98477 Transcript_24938/m.98477 type:complete len:306 (+) Transcript_24938:1147-2064(+)